MVLGTCAFSQMVVNAHADEKTYHVTVNAVGRVVNTDGSKQDIQLDSVQKDLPAGKQDNPLGEIKNYTRKSSTIFITSSKEDQVYSSFYDGNPATPSVKYQLIQNDGTEAKDGIKPESKFKTATVGGKYNTDELTDESLANYELLNPDSKKGIISDPNQVIVLRYKLAGEPKKESEDDKDKGDLIAEITKPILPDEKDDETSSEKESDKPASIDQDTQTTLPDKVELIDSGVQTGGSVKPAGVDSDSQTDELPNLDKVFGIDADTQTNEEVKKNEVVQPERKISILKEFKPNDVTSNKMEQEPLTPSISKPTKSVKSTLGTTNKKLTKKDQKKQLKSKNSNTDKKTKAKSSLNHDSLSSTQEPVEGNHDSATQSLGQKSKLPQTSENRLTKFTSLIGISILAFLGLADRIYKKRGVQ